MLRLVLSIVIGLGLGLGIGLYVGWNLVPVQYVESPMSALSPRYKDDYVVMVAAAYQVDGDLNEAIRRLQPMGVSNIPVYVRDVTERYISESGSGNENDIRTLVFHVAYCHPYPRIVSAMRRNLWIIVGLVCLAAGISGGLYYAWKVSPLVQTNTAPWQLSADGQRQYMIAVSLAFARDHDLKRSVDRLVDLQLGDKTWQAVADAACDLARTSYVSTNTGLAAVRSMVELAKSQGATGCASTLLPLYTSTPGPTSTIATVTPSLIPPSTKTPIPTLGPTFTPATSVAGNTPTPGGDFRVTLVEPFCSAKTPGIIEVTVQDSSGTGIPGIQVEVSTDSDKDDFFTGLKPERGPGFADYSMPPNGAYTVSVPGSSDRSRPLTPTACTVAPKDGGGQSVTSYRVVFRRSGS